MVLILLLLEQNGFVATNPKAYRKAKRKLAKLQKELCRRTKGGSNRENTKSALAKKHSKLVTFGLMRCTALLNQV